MNAKDNEQEHVHDNFVIYVSQGIFVEITFAGKECYFVLSIPPKLLLTLSSQGLENVKIREVKLNM